MKTIKMKISFISLIKKYNKNYGKKAVTYCFTSLLTTYENYTVHHKYYKHHALMITKLFLIPKVNHTSVV
jgi:hypothetical protein